MIQFDEVFRLDGFSIGSKATSLWIKPLDVLFDIGNLHINAIPINTLLLSHAHGDHASAITAYLSQRRLFSLPHAKIYVHSKTYELFTQLLAIWQKLEDLEYHFELISVEEGKLYELKKNYFFSASPVQHRIPSLGYTIYEKKKKLKTDYLQASQEEIMKLREQNIDIFAMSKIPMFSYLGDCSLDSFLENPVFTKSRYVALECTFIDSKRSIDHAKEWGHIHLEEILQHAESFQEIEKILLIHFSARYTKEYVERIVTKKCPPEFMKKIVLL
ncbi:MAG: MBL fold metallo-hydrolase [Candidatus Brocadiae bacterium]|nr:MBL fold metallo-hydrolase [Candidatus Brocadiia bacterium]